jgi:hypothetical protein
MARPLGFVALARKRFGPNVHLYPPLVLLSCLIASTAAPAEGSFAHEDLGTIKELSELLAPGFGPAPEIRVGLGGLGLANPMTGTAVPPFRYAAAPAGDLIDGFVVPSGYFLARTTGVPGGFGFRLSAPLTFRWTGTASTPPLQLSWQAGTLFDNVFNGATGGFVPFRVVAPGFPEPGEANGTEPFLSIAAEPASEDPGPGEGGEVFETAQLPPGPGTTRPGEPSGDHSGDPTDGPDGQGPDGTPVPGPLPVAGVAIAWRCSRRLRQRLRQAR